MKKNLTVTKIIVKIRNAYAFQIENSGLVSSDKYFGLMTEALYEFARASRRIQREVLKDRISRAAVAAWIEHTQPAFFSATENTDDQNEHLIAAEKDTAMVEYMKKYFTAESVLSVLCWTEQEYIWWDDRTVTQTPGHSQIGVFLGKHYGGTRRRHIPSGERRLRGAH